MAKASPKLLLQALVSNAALTELYELRKALRPSEENRTRAAVLVTGTLFLLTMAFILAMAWTREDAGTFLSKHPGVVTFASPAFVRDVAPDGTIGLHVTVGAERFAALGARGERLVVLLPALAYARAALTVNGSPAGTSFDDGRVSYAFDPAALPAAGGLRLDLALRPGPKPAPAAYEGSILIMTLADFRAYEAIQATSRAGRGDVVGAIARVAMAVFVLVLFLLIDGSPETLGLGLFLGFEALAISLSFGWLAMPGLEVLRHFSYQMGDIFRLYYFLQMARMIDKRVAPWLLWGAASSLPYGLLREFGVAWAADLPQLRDLTVGSLGLVVCLRAAFFLRGKGLPWRVLALWVAAAGAFEQVLDPLGMMVPALHDTGAFATLTDLLQPIAAWLLAFSAFINISTLENRVRTLSVLAARAREMEKEMELGRTVQQAFLSLPKMPAELRVAAHHEAMLYVSGDTYFVDWNEAKGKLTFLINDVTGHGVQAALKASGVTVIANTVWGDKAPSAWQPRRLETYAALVTDFFEKMDAAPDILALGGGEFDVATGRLELFRYNFPYPLVIEPRGAMIEDAEGVTPDDVWRVALLPLPSARTTVHQMAPGSFVLLTSDGLLDNSRRTRDFLRYLRLELATRGKGLTADDIKGLILKCPLVTARKDDDKTLTIFHWLPEARGQALKVA